MKPKATITVATLVEMVNSRNRTSTCAPAIREGWNDLLADILHDTGNYAGFGYLRADQVPVDEKPGIAGEHPNFTFPDESRRQYIFHTFRANARA